jgi:uncharacterized protein YvpB
MMTLYALTIKDGAFTFTPVAEPITRILPVKWIGQNTARPDDDYSNSDCGPACVAMWLGYRGVTVSVDDVSRATSKPPGYIYTVFADLDRAANQYGLDLVHQFGTLTLEIIRREIDARRPVLALVHYPSLPDRFSATYAQSHWILIVGYEGKTYFYHDPYWPTEAGGALNPISAADLVKALQNVTANGNTAMQGATQKTE